MCKTDFEKKMEELIKEDYKDSFDKNELELRSDTAVNEKRLDELMSKARKLLRDNYKNDGKEYPPAMLFYKARKAIDKDPLTNIFKEMPKGGNLHIHTGACADIDCFLDLLQNDKEINKNVYIYLGEAAKPFIYGTLLYLNCVPDNKDIMLLSTALKERISKAELIDLLTISSDKYVSGKYMWDAFHDCLNRVSTILNVRIIYDKYYESTIKSLIKDNIDYAELRVLIRPVLVDYNSIDSQKSQDTPQADPKPSIDPNKKELVERIFKVYKKVVSDTKSDFKLRVIISGSRSGSQSVDDTLEHLKITSALMKCEELKDNGDNFVIGYDIVSEEDKGKKTEEYAQMIIDNKNLDVPLYLHDGESRWGDNTNLHAAYLLGSKRVGHGLNIHNFPKLIDRFIKNDIALEVCPISNQILGYVDDFRVHPIGSYLKRGLQCVIGSDDPQLFNHSSLAYDFWVLYYGLFLDLKAIKKLIKNSYIYSGLSETEKKAKVNEWQKKWENFVPCAIKKLESFMEGDK